MRYLPCSNKLKASLFAINSILFGVGVYSKLLAKSGFYLLRCYDNIVKTKKAVLRSGKINLKFLFCIYYR